MSLLFLFFSRSELTSVDRFSSNETVFNFGHPTTYNGCCEFKPEIKVDGDLKKHWTTMVNMAYDSFNVVLDFSEELSEVLITSNKLPDPHPLNDPPVVSNSSKYS